MVMACDFSLSYDLIVAKLDFVMLIAQFLTSSSCSFFLGFVHSHLVYSYRNQLVSKRDLLVPVLFDDLLLSSLNPDVIWLDSDNWCRDLIPIWTCSGVWNWLVRINENFLFGDCIWVETDSENLEIQLILLVLWIWSTGYGLEVKFGILGCSDVLNLKFWIYWFGVNWWEFWILVQKFGDWTCSEVL